mmetsp:Transcript_32272/g.74548  ORF Transcript_32272/g.74548 Transcript_32272/m.74548 type:complete len:311 (-) Transcript_32272:144-1076(-)
MKCWTCSFKAVVALSYAALHQNRAKEHGKSEQLGMAAEAQLSVRTQCQRHGKASQQCSYEHRLELLSKERLFNHLIFAEHRHGSLPKPTIRSSHNSALRDLMVWEGQLVALPVCHDPSGASNHRDQSAVIVYTKICFNHKVNAEAGSQEPVCIAVAAIERSLYSTSERGEAPLFEARAKHVGCRGIQHGILQTSSATRLNLVAIESCSVVCPQPPFSENALINHAKNGFPVLKKCNEGPKQRLPGDEGLRAVNRIQHPHPFGISPHVVELFTDNPMLGISGFDQSAHNSLCFSIGNRNRALSNWAIRLVL